MSPSNGLSLFKTFEKGRKEFYVEFNDASSELAFHIFTQSINVHVRYPISTDDISKCNSIIEQIESLADDFYSIATDLLFYANIIDLTADFINIYYSFKTGKAQITISTGRTILDLLLPLTDILADPRKTIELVIDKLRDNLKDYFNCSKAK